MADVAVAHHVFLSLHAELAGGTDVFLGLVGLEVGERVNLGPNEPLLEVGVDHAGGLRGRGPDRYRPRANLLLARREIALQAERLVGGPCERGERRLREPRAGKHLPPVGLVEFGDFGLELRTDWHDLRAGRGSRGADLLHEWALALEIGLVDVGHVENRLRCQEAEFLDGGPLGLIQRERAKWLFGNQVGEAFLHHLDLELGILVGPLGRPLQLGQAVFQMLDVGEHQFDLDCLHVGDRIDLARHMDHIGILEAADNLENRVDLADMRQELVAEALALAGTLHDAGDVDQLQSGGNHLLRWDVFRDQREAAVGHAHHTLVGLDRAEGVVRALRGLRHGQRVEERALADVGESDDACFHDCNYCSGGWEKHYDGRKTPIIIDAVNFR